MNPSSIPRSRRLPRRCAALLWPCLLLLLPAGVPRAADAPAPPAPFAVPGARAIASPAGTSGSAAAGADERHLLQLGAGDSVNVQVYGQPDMDTTVYVGDDGTISVPLAGSVQVGGLTPVEAQKRVEQALRQGQFLLDPHVTISVTQSRSQRVSVLGEIKDPGRYPIEPNTTVFDLLAQAGGVTAFSSDIIYILRPDASGKVNRYPINLKGFSDQKNALPTQTLQAGDSVYVPRAEQFYIYGEVAAPNMYRIEPGMTVIQAIARAGGITPRGSEHRIEIKRSGKDGKYVITHAKPGDLVQSDDVIRVKESIF